ncbi:MAG: TrkH family potassium uptake protein [Anaerovorax sp.]
MSMSSVGSMNSFKSILSYVGTPVMWTGATLFLPLFSLLFFPNEQGCMKYFIAPAVISMLIGYGCTKIVQREKKVRLSKYQNAVIITLSWSLAVVIYAMPFLLTGEYTITQAVFESTSGWSTTGLSVMNVDTLPKMFLLHRSNMMFFGGVGIVLIMICFLPGTYGMSLFSAEGHTDMLLPNLMKTSRLILAIYSAFITLGAVLYVICGMSVFDAINHSITAIATGGFSTRSQSIGYYNSLSIEMVTIFLMLLGTISFMAHVSLLMGKWKTFFNNSEMKATAVICALSVPIVAFAFSAHVETSLSEGFRVSAFQVVSALSTTGMQTIPDFNAIPSAGFLILVVLMLVGGQSGSTAGGIKQYRVVTMVKSMYWEIRNSCRNNRLRQVEYITKPGSDRLVTQSMKAETGLFIFVYLLLFALGALVITFFGYSVDQAIFEVSSAMGGVGLSAGVTAADAPPVVLWVLIIEMFLGRLEIYVVLFAVVNTFRRNKI